MTRALILNAVSTPEQARKFSLDHQEATSRAYCTAQGWEVIDSLRSDTSRSKHDNIDDIAKVNKAFASLKRHIEAKDFDVLVIHSFDRLARDSALITQIIQRIIRAGASIFAHQGGTVDARNYLAISGSIGFMVAAPIATFVEKSQVTKRELARRGLPTAGPPFSHHIIRDKDGKRRRMQVREELRPLWDAVFKLLVEDKQSMHFFEDALAELGHVAEDGHKHNYGKIWKLLHHPTAWGHIALGWHPDKHEGKRVAGNWAFDRTVPPPVGVEMLYDATEAIWTGEQATRMIEELRYRHVVQAGRAKPAAKYAFTGLLVCSDCGWKMQAWTDNVVRKRDGLAYVGWRCVSLKQRKMDCTAKGSISDAKVRRWMDTALRQLVRDGDFSPIINARPAEDMDLLQRTFHEAERELLGLLRDAARADSDLAPYYTQLISPARQRVQIARAAIDAARQRQADTTASEQAEAIRVLQALTIDKLWELPNDEINRILHMLFANYRLVVEKNEIVGILPR